MVSITLWSGKSGPSRLPCDSQRQTRVAYWYLRVLCGQSATVFVVIERLVVVES